MENSKKYKVNLLCKDGPLDGRMLQIETSSQPGEHITFKTSVGNLKYQLMDGPAVRVAIKDGEAHPNLCGNLLFVPDIDPANTL